MKAFEKLYEELKMPKSISWVLPRTKRFDFAILYTTMFFGKPYHLHAIQPLCTPTRKTSKTSIIFSRFSSL